MSAVESAAVLIPLVLLAIAGAAALGRRNGAIPSLLLVTIGAAAGFFPALEAVRIPPDVVLLLLLPPLLHASAVSVPSMNFRRDLAAISGLSVLLVIGTALAVGVFFAWAVPGLGFGWGVALGAIVSPTDAVAVGLLRRERISQRVSALLEGESLLNDATALTLLRTAIAGAATGFSLWAAAGSFLYAVAVAAVIGVVAGSADLWIRGRIANPALNTVVSLAVPFLVAVSAELLHSSGLVAVVIAGLVTGYGGPRRLSPQNRLSATQTWRAVEVVLEGVIFLTMGLQLHGIVAGLGDGGRGVAFAVLLAASALAILLLARAAHLVILVTIDMRMRRPHLDEAPPRPTPQMPTGRAARRVLQRTSDRRYFEQERLDWRGGAITVWAGVRGAVTVAAAQTLPVDTPYRPLLVLTAFAVAALSLTVQGGTVPLLLRHWRGRDDGSSAERSRAEDARLVAFITETVAAVSAPGSSARADAGPPGTGRSRGELFAASKQQQLALISAKRAALLDARDDGLFDARALTAALDNLDAAQIALQISTT